MMFSQYPVLVPTLMGILALYLIFAISRDFRQKKPPLPPGPFRWPIVGSVFSFPQTLQWITFAEWRKVYGGVTYSSIFGRSVVVINSVQAALDLLDKRSSIYSDRPRMVMLGELVGWNQTLMLTPYNARFREMRRLANGVLGPGVVGAFNSLEKKACTRFLGRLLDTPEDLLGHIRYTAGAIILSISYGYDVSESGKDPLVDLAESTIEESTRPATPGSFLVDFLPWLRHIPASLPGMGFRRLAATWRQHMLQMAEVPHQFTKSQMAQGTARPSFVSTLLEKECTPQTEDMIKWAAMSLYTGGSDTTVAAVSSFFLVMCTHPHIQLAAQEELDRVIGSERLPSVSDRTQLPYIDALMKEVMRWSPIVPMGIPHLSTHEDIYNGYRIPAGSVVLTNIWGMLHDSEVFPDPHAFRPERFLGGERADGINSDPLELVFGFGRSMWRICPGQHLAEIFLFLSIAMSLVTFNITKAHDEHGNIIEPEIEWLNKGVCHPKPFKCRIEPRSTQAAGLVRNVITELEDES